MDHVLRERLVDLLLVVIDGCLRILQVPDVVKHIKGVFQRHQEVVHLVETVPISDNLLEQEREQGAMPVQESASSGFSHDDLPAAHHLQLVIPVLDFDKLT